MTNMEKQFVPTLSWNHPQHLTVKTEADTHTLKIPRLMKEVKGNMIKNWSDVAQVIAGRSDRETERRRDSVLRVLTDRGPTGAEYRSCYYYAVLVDAEQHLYPFFEWNPISDVGHFLSYEKEEMKRTRLPRYLNGRMREWLLALAASLEAGKMLAESEKVDRSTPLRSKAA